MSTVNPAKALLMVFVITEYPWLNTLSPYSAMETKVGNPAKEVKLVSANQIAFDTAVANSARLDQVPLVVPPIILGDPSYRVHKLETNAPVGLAKL